MQIQGKLIQRFTAQNVIKQGYRQSLLTQLVRKVDIIPGGSIFNRSSLYLAYAEDIVLLAKNTNILEENMNQFQNKATLARLKININKYFENVPNSTLNGT